MSEHNYGKIVWMDMEMTGKQKSSEVALVFIKIPSFRPRRGEKSSDSSGVANY